MAKIKKHLFLLTRYMLVRGCVLCYPLSEAQIEEGPIYVQVGQDTRREG